MERSSKKDSKNRARGSVFEVIVRQCMEKKCHHHIKKSWTFLQSPSMGVLALTLYGGCLIEVRQKLVLGHSP